MNLRLPLSLKIGLLVLLTLVMLSAVLVMFAAVQFRVSPESFIVLPTFNRILSLSGQLALDLAETPEPARAELLDRFSKEYGFEFYLADPRGRSLAGESVELPAEIRAELGGRFGEESGRRGPPPGQGGGGGGGGRPPGPGLGLGLGRRPAILQATTQNPSRYWVGVRIPVRSAEDPRPVNGYLLLATDSFLGFFDPKPWLALTLALVVVFALVWLPLIRRLTHAITEMTNATGQIAEGQFDIRLAVKRNDEVGQLASSINRMSTQLAGFVKGQKRFLADIAHELCAPVARMQVALGILEQRAEDHTREYVADVKDDAQHMSELINELMSFSKAGMQVGETPIVRVDVAETVRRVIELEAKSGARIETSIDPGAAVMANPDQLFRAISNLVRNAIRYAGQAGPILISARTQSPETLITVADSGPGLPEQALEEIFAPFYRLERSRGRDSGGTGLGLAIVKACVEACKGTVRAMNRKPSGLEVEIRLQTSPADSANS